MASNSTEADLSGALKPPATSIDVDTGSSPAPSQADSVFDGQPGAPNLKTDEESQSSAGQLLSDNVQSVVDPDAEAYPGPDVVPSAPGEAKSDDTDEHAEDSNIEEVLALATKDDMSDSSRGSDSDDSYDSGSESDSESEFQKRLKKIKTETLYKAMRSKFQYHDTDQWSAKPSELVRGIVGYVSTLEHRLEETEDELSRVKRKVFPDSKKKTRSRKKKADEETQELDTALLDADFYHCSELVTKDWRYKNHDEAPGSSEFFDKASLIAAVYEWNDNLIKKPPVLEIGEHPRPQDIDIIEIMISSTPLVEFLRKRLDVVFVGSGGTLKFGKPFRPLLRELKALKDDMVRLEDKYRSVEGPDRDSEEERLQAASDSKPEKVASPMPKAVRTATNSKNEGPSATGEDSVPPQESREALDHFRVVVDFMEKYLGDSIHRYQRVREGRQDKITFPDLWMLFERGDTVFCPFREGDMEYQDTIFRMNPGPLASPGKANFVTRRIDVPQAYRVLGVHGGVPTFMSLTAKTQDLQNDNIATQARGPPQDAGTDRDATNEDTTPDSGDQPVRTGEKYNFLIMQCMYIDFDGGKFGPCAEFFVFRPFSGEVDIASLEVYPARLMPTNLLRSLNPDSASHDTLGHGADCEAWSDALVHRGRNFLNATEVSHRQYDSLSVGRSREEISSPVIIDFKLAFQEAPNQILSDRKSIIPLLSFEPALMVNGLTELHYSSCDKPRCQNIACQNGMAILGSMRRHSIALSADVRSTLDEYDTLPGVKDPKARLETFKSLMEEKQLIQLLPGMVHGFALRNRAWVQLDVAKLQPIVQESQWDRLVLPKGHRQIVQAMVETHSRGTTENDEEPGSLGKVEMDLVQGKGKGCIILLHGVPGVGKTSTAECVAAHTKRPLYPITCGDVGSNPADVEKNMGSHFKLAHRWGCVLLLDEADVFLAKRDKSDVVRNGLVSVFLRILEYYPGILFLTTNRVGAIDDAFRSRLHLTLYYPRLNEKQIRKIWQANLDHLELINEQRKKKGIPSIEFDRKKILKWARKNHKNPSWNGRQIRNAFQTAVALSEFKAREQRKKRSDGGAVAPVMEVWQFKLIANASIQFSQYLHETLGDDEDAVANEDRIRAFEFKTKRQFKVKDSWADETSEDDDESEDEESSDSDGEESENSDDEDSEDDSEEETKNKRKGKSKKKDTKKSKEKKDKKGKDKRK